MVTGSFNVETAHKKTLEDLTKGKIRWDYPLGKKTTFKAGGNVAGYYEANYIMDLAKVLGFLNKEHIPSMIVGRGSNLLITDNGYDGIAIRLRGELASVQVSRDTSTRLEVGAGAAVWELLTFCRKHGLTGLEFLAGIPGTMGGLVVMNAGAFGHEISARIKWVDMLGVDGIVRRGAIEDLVFSYRGMDKDPDSAIICAGLSLQPDDPVSVSERIKKYLVRRKGTQPLEYPSAGSIFKNPPGLYAGKLIEECGLKGARVGHAVVSAKHANFIINTGGAKAKDIIQLINLVRERVKEEFDIDLELEIQIVGQ